MQYSAAVYTRYKKHNRTRISLIQHGVAVLILLALSFLSSHVYATPAGDNILISEVGYHNTSNDPGAEWFELFNPTASEINIGGWTISDGEGTLTFPAPTLIPAGGYFLLAHTTATFNSVNPGVPVNLAYGAIDVGSIFLSNTGDQLTLRDDGGNEVDFVEWENGSDWDIEALSGESIARQTSIDTDTSADWQSNQTPTPGTGDLVAAQLNTAPIPTLSQWGLWLLIALFAIALRRQTPRITSSF